MRTHRVFWFSVVAAVMLVATLLAYLLGTSQVTPQMLTNYRYFRWAHGMADITPECLSAFERDRRFQQRFVGQPVEVLRHQVE